MILIPGLTVLLAFLAVELTVMHGSTITPKPPLWIAVMFIGLAVLLMLVPK